MSTKKTAVILWSFLFILIAIIFVTSGMRVNVRCVFDPRDNSTSLEYYPREFYAKHKEIINIVDGIILGTLLSTLCTVCVVACTVIIAAKMKQVSLWRETVSSATDHVIS
ncbi:hypothetical protein ACOMHN_066677 [Nucella lapillus]